MPPLLGKSLFDLLTVKNSKISNAAAVQMLVVAGIYEALEALIDFIPAVGPILALIIPLFSLVTYGFVWFPLKEVPFIKGKWSLMKIFAFGGGEMVEFIPFVNAFTPGIFMGVLGVIVAQRLEELEEQRKEPEQKPAPKLLSIRMGGPIKIPTAANEGPEEEMVEAA